MCPLPAVGCKMKVHFTVHEVLGYFVEEVGDESLTRQQIVDELQRRIALEDVRVDGKLIRVRDIFFIDHTRPIDQQPKL